MSLLQLPYELRLRIYDYLYYRSCCEAWDTSLDSRQHEGKEHCPSRLHHACRLLRDETEALFYKCHFKFYFADRQTLDTWLARNYDWLKDDEDYLEVSVLR